MISSAAADARCEDREPEVEASGRSEIKLLPYEQAYEAGFEDMRRRVPDTSKIETLMGWKPTLSLDQTLDEVIGQFRQAAQHNG